MKLAGTEPAPVVVAHPTGRWITTAEASKRSGLVVGQVNRLRLQEGWESRGLARKVKLPSGQYGWELDEGCDPRFERANSPEQRAAKFDWNTVEKESAAKALARLKILTAISSEVEAAFANAHDVRTREDIIRDFIDRTGLQKSARTVMRWDEKFRRDELPWSLLDGRQDAPADESPAADFEPFYKLMEDWYLNQGEPKMARCYALAKREALKTNLPFPCLRHAQRHFEAMSIARKIFARKGPKAFDDQCAAYCQRDFTRIRVIERGKPVTRAMQSDDIWCADHHPCDVIVQMPPDKNGEMKLKRPWLSVWQDLRSRRIVGYRFLLTDPNSSTVMLVLRDAIINAGLRLPRFCYTDNGKDYDAWFWDGRTKRERKARVSHDQTQFAGIYAQLGIGHIHATPYNAKAKPVERFFRTFEEGFNNFEPTYCGRNPQEKPEQLAARLARGAAPVFQDWAARAIDWIESSYHNDPCRGHGMDGRSPLEVYTANVGTAASVRPVLQKQLDCCLQMVSKPIKVGRNGITIQNKTYGKNDPALRALFGKLVMVRIDPSDVRYATVWSPEGQRLATLAENELAIFDTTSDATHREFLSRQRRHNNQLKEVQKRGMRPVRSAAELMIEDSIEQARRRAAENPLPEPPRPGVELVNTGLENPSNDDRPTFKKAVGDGSPGFLSSTLARLAEED